MELAKKYSVFLLEDDPVLGEALSIALELENFKVFRSHNLSEAREAFTKQDYDIAILDINLPDGSGMDFCKDIREQGSRTPVVFLTAKTDEETLLRCLSIGGNDFVKKPYSQKELIARINVLLNLNNWQRSPESSGLVIDQDVRDIFYKGAPLGLNRRQYDILSFFLQRPGKVVTREQLLEHLDRSLDIYDRTIDSHLSQTRKALKNADIEHMKIVSVYGVGYRLEVE